jgi:serine protease Do
MAMKRLIGLFLMAIVGGFVALGSYRYIEKSHPSYVYSSEPGIPVHAARYVPGAAFNQPDFEAAAAISVHAVVHIKSEFQNKSSVYDDFFDFFNFGRPVPNSPVQALGSGVIVTSDGYIVTNNHVVQDASTITVTLNDKRVFQASIVGTDPSTDLALLKIEATSLSFLAFGNSDDVKIGEWVLAVGNPFNLTSTVTAGIVSAKARNINILGSQGAIESFIQTDAAVNPGNSGGALVNTRGELIGVNAAIASGTGNYVGYSFAIPVNIVKKVVEDFMKYGKIQRAYLGIYYKEIDDQFAKDKGLASVQGIYVDDVVQGGAADKAGVKKGDVIMSLQGTPVNSKSELLEAVSQHSPGDKLSIGLIRDGKQQDVVVTLLSENENNVVVTNDKIIIHGATFQKISDQEKKRFNLLSGYKIIHLDNGLLRSTGIKEGFIIYAIDKQPINSIQELKDALTSRKGGVLIEGVYPNGLRAYYGIGL